MKIRLAADQFYQSAGWERVGREENGEIRYTLTQISSRPVLSPKLS